MKFARRLRPIRLSPTLYSAIATSGAKGSRLNLDGRTGVPPSNFLPHVAGILGNHRLTGFAVPCLLKFRHVLHDAVDPILPRRMRVDADQHPRKLGTPLLAPNSPVTEEKALFWCEAINLCLGFAGFVFGDHLLKSHQGDACATVIGGVLAESEFAV